MGGQVKLYGSDGQQFSTYTARNWPLGTQLVLQDGRCFRFALKSAAAAVAGDMQQAAANTANHVGLAVQAAAAVGATSVSVTLGATATTADEYADGYLVIDTSPGNGYSYRIRTHAAAGSGATQAVTLYSTDSVQVALTTSSVASLIHNPYRSVVVAPTTHSQTPAGVAVKPIAASEYGWLQTKGPAAVKGIGTLVIGDPVILSGTTAGGVGPMAGAGAATEVQVGWCMRVAATTLHSTIYLTLD